ncbi:hypothetical protein HKX48_001137 [Thoreauomyces humboldtii]|nr:hypothetical protein HKX48_001137 [Thoreauomyces humboldtii]
MISTPSCFPIEVQSLPAKGRGFVFTRDVPAGSVVLTSGPYAIVPESTTKTEICAHCIGRSKSLHHLPPSKPVPYTPLSVFCQDCHQVRYCSDACATLDRDLYHRFECGYLKHLFRDQPAVLPDDLQLRTFSKDKKDAEKYPNRLDLTPYELDFTLCIARIVIRRAREMKRDMDDGLFPEVAVVAGSQNPHDRDSFANVWALCSNSKDFSSAIMDRFELVAKSLTTLVTDHILPVLFPDAQAAATRNILPRVTDQDLHADPDRGNRLTDLQASVLALVCKEECNSFGLYSFLHAGRSETRQSYALGVFHRAVFFNHSCVPNVGHCVRTASSSKDQEGEGGRRRETGPATKQITFYATRDIKRGEEALICYIPLDKRPSACSRSRTKGLEDLFFFPCDCERCSMDAGNLDPEKAKDVTRRFADLCCDGDNCFGWMVPTALDDRLNDDQEEKERGSGREAETDSAKDLTETAGKDCNKWRCEACGIVTSR